MNRSRLPFMLMGWGVGAMLAGAALWFAGVLPSVPAPLLGIGALMIAGGVGGLLWLVQARRRRGGPIP